MNLKVSEIFYSLQGEGARAGEPTVFIRLQGCKAQYACAASGIKCDTEFESGKEMRLEDILAWIDIHGSGCKWITWTGGEPTDQLTTEMVAYFKATGFSQSIETSGLNAVPDGLDFVTLSPKVAEHICEKNFPHGVTEVRYVRHFGQAIPQPKVQAKYYFVSPHSDGFTINSQNLKHCIELCKANPIWRLSIQQHKLWQVL